MKATTTPESRRRLTGPRRPRRVRRARHHALMELVASATRALAVLRARCAAPRADARSFGPAIGR
jgi:hypothetical protein